MGSHDHHLFIRLGRFFEGSADGTLAVAALLAIAILIIMVVAFQFRH